MSEARERKRESAQFQILRLVEREPHLSQRQLAERLGISLGSTHYVLRGLIEKGLVKLRRFHSSTDKRRYAYVLTPSGLAAKSAITRIFLTRKRAEYEMLKREIEELGAELERNREQ